MGEEDMRELLGNLGGFCKICVIYVLFLGILNFKVRVVCGVGGV